MAVLCRNQSVVYFNRIGTFEAPYCYFSVKGEDYMQFAEDYMHYVDSLDTPTSMKHTRAMPLTKVTVGHFKRGSCDRNTR